MKPYISIPLEEYVSQKQLDRAIAERDELAERIAELQEQARVAEENHKFVVEQGLRQRDQAVSLADTLRQERDEARDEVSLLRSTVTDHNIEIERLRKERDEARAEVCAHEADTSDDQREYAKMRGWDCFLHTDGASYPEIPDNSQQAIDRVARLDEELGL